MSTNDFTSNNNTWFESYFEDRLAPIEHDLQVWAVKVYFLEDRGTHDAILQKVRIALWRRFSENPEEWAVLPRERWLAYAKETFRWGVTAFHRDGIKWLGLVASDMDCVAEGCDITDDEALSMVYTDHTNSGHFAYPREIQLAELRMVRALQMRVNRRTARYAKLVDGEQAEQAELIEALRRLAEDQSRIHQITRDLESGKNR